MTMKQISSSLIFATLLLSSCARGPAVVKRQAPAPQPFPVRIVELNGTATELGQSYGKQLSKPIHYLFDHYLKPYFTSEMQRFLALTAASGFETKLSPEHREEVKALAKQTELDEREMMLAQCFLDLSPMTACSTITLPAEASPDHVARFGRNLDFASMNVADKQTVIMIYRPAGRYQFAAVSWPGLIGVLSGMNEYGLTLANMEVDRSAGLPVAMPYTLLYRTVLERCRTVNEAIHLLETTPRQTANNLMLMDAAGDRAVVEITPEAIVVRRGKEGSSLISTNHQRAQDMDSTGRCWRYDYLHKSSGETFGKLDVKGVESMLGHVAQGESTLQSMVFEPANRVLYLAVGKNAPTRGYSRLDLKPYFAGQVVPY